MIAGILTVVGGAIMGIVSKITESATTIAITAACLLILTQLLMPVFGVQPVQVNSNFADAVDTTSNYLAGLDPIFPVDSIINIMQLIFLLETGMITVQIITWFAKRINH